MPKLKIDGTQTAVNNPSSRCPENQRNAETAKDIITAKRMKKSDFLIIVIFLLFIPVSYGRKETPWNCYAGNCSKAGLASNSELIESQKAHETAHENQRGRNKRQQADRNSQSLPCL